MTEQDQRSPTAGAGDDRHPSATPTRGKGYTQTPLGKLVDAFATRAIGIIVNVLVVLTVGLLVWAVVALGFVISDTVQQRDATAIKSLILGILTIFIIIEIFDLFREYLRSAHIKVTNLAEVSLAVVLRELWLLLLEGSTDWKLYLSLAAVVAALGGFWWLAQHGSAPEAQAKPAPERAATSLSSLPGSSRDAGPRAAAARPVRPAHEGFRPYRCLVSFAPLQWAISSVGERPPHTREVVGSSPTSPTTLPAWPNATPPVPPRKSRV